MKSAKRNPRDQIRETKEWTKKEKKSKSSAKGSESGDEGTDRREKKSKESKVSKDTESGDEGQEKTRGRKTKPREEDEMGGGTKSKSDRSASRSRSRSRPRGEKEKDADKKKKDKKKRLDLNDPSHGLQAALRAESRARGRDVSKKKDSKDKKLEDGTYKPYHDMDDSESTNNSGSQNSGKKKKKKSKKRSSSSDRGIKSSRERGKPETYEPARVTRRSRSGERLPLSEPQNLGATPDPVIGPSFDPPADTEPMSPSVKRKKKKKPENDRDSPPSPILNSLPDPDSDDEDSVQKGEAVGKLGKKLDQPVDDDNTPKTRNRTSYSTEETVSSSTSAHSIESPKPGSKGNINSRGKRVSPRTPRKEPVKMSPRKAPSSNDSPKAPLHPSPGKGPRRRVGSRTGPDDKSLTPTKRTPTSKRSRKPGEAQIYGSDGKEIRLPIDSDESDVAEPEKDEKPSENDDGKEYSESPEETSAMRSLGKTAPRVKPKNPKLVQQLRECVRLVSLDQTGPAIEASLQGLAEYLAAKAMVDGSGEQSKLVAEILLADFRPRNKNAEGMGGTGLVPKEVAAESMSNGANGEKASFDPYEPETPPRNRRPPSEGPAKGHSPTSSKTSPRSRPSPIRKQNSAQKIGEPPLASAGEPPVNGAVPTPANHVGNQHQSVPSRPQPSTNGAPIGPPISQPAQAFVPQQNWTEEQRRQAYSQYQAQQQYFAQQQQQQQRGPQVSSQNFHQPNAPNQQYYPQHQHSQQGHANTQYGNVQHPVHANIPREPHVVDPRAPHGGQHHRPPQGYAPSHGPPQYHPQYPQNQQVPQQQQYRPHPQAQYQQQHSHHPQHPYPQHQHFAPQQPHPNPQNIPPPPQQQPMYNVARQESTGSNDSALTPLKQSILREWALLPPAMQALRPVEHLIFSVHEVFPPRFGVPTHAHFAKWTAIPVTDLWTDGSRLDENALKKTLRKFKAFLHPDKLPKDLTEPQAFVCKLLWDVIQDAETEYKKKVEELDWVQ
uniref:J domain-containing protein n=1 Tax=Amphora coffeiformis TaxID=265554 RepID=A0A7S3L9T0_9STRA